MPRIFVALVAGLFVCVTTTAVAQLPTAAVWVNCENASAAEKAAYLSFAKTMAGQFFVVPEADDRSAVAPPVCRSFRLPAPEDTRLSLSERVKDSLPSLGFTRSTVVPEGASALLVFEFRRAPGKPPLFRRGEVLIVTDSQWWGTSASVQSAPLQDGERLVLRSGLGKALYEFGLTGKEPKAVGFAASPHSRLYGDAAVEVPSGFED